MATLNIISGQPTLTPAASLEYSQSQREKEASSSKPLKRAKSRGGKTKKRNKKKK
jgi:hypothetical protein